MDKQTPTQMKHKKCNICIALGKIEGKKELIKEWWSAGDIKEVRTEGFNLAIEKVQDEIRIWFKEEYLIGALSCDVLRDKVKLNRLKERLNKLNI
jgi:hypothetical protein